MIEGILIITINAIIFFSLGHESGKRREKKEANKDFFNIVNHYEKRIEKLGNE